MHLSYYCRWFKFGIMTMDSGGYLLIRFNKYVCRIYSPMPLEKATLSYSIKHQGLYQSLRNRFYVPPKDTGELPAYLSGIPVSFLDSKDYKPAKKRVIEFFLLTPSPRLKLLRQRYNKAQFGE